MKNMNDNDLIIYQLHRRQSKHPPDGPSNWNILQYSSHFFYCNYSQHTPAIIPNAVVYNLLIVDSSDPNLFQVALSSFSAWLHFVDLYINIQNRDHYQKRHTLGCWERASERARGLLVAPLITAEEKSDADGTSATRRVQQWTHIIKPRHKANTLSFLIERGWN